MSNFVGKRPIVLALAVLVALLIAACGGSSDSTTSSAEKEAAPSAVPAKPAEAAAGKERAVAQAGRRQAGKLEPAAKQKLRKPTDAKGEGAKGDPSRPAASGKGGNVLDERLEELVGGKGGKGGERVVSSPEEIQEVIEELQEGSGQGSGSGPVTVEETLEKVLGGG